MGIKNSKLVSVSHDGYIECCWERKPDVQILYNSIDVRYNLDCAGVYVIPTPKNEELVPLYHLCKSHDEIQRIRIWPKHTTHFETPDKIILKLDIRRIFPHEPYDLDIIADTGLNDVYICKDGEEVQLPLRKPELIEA